MTSFSRSRVVASLLAVATLPVLGANYQFNVASGDWQTGTNWNPNGVPGSPDNATINNGRTVTINTGTGTVASSGDPLNNLHVGGNQDGASTGNGTLTQTGGTLHSDWLRIGRGNGRTGTVNLSGGTMNILAQGLFVGGENDNATGFMNISGGTLNVGNRFRVGHVANVATAGDSAGTLTMTAGAVNSTADILVGHRENDASTRVAHGTFNLSGGTVTGTQLRAGVGASAVLPGGAFGTINMSGGVVSLNNNGFRHGQNGGTAVLNLSGGTVSQTTGHAVFGDGPAGRATATHSGTFTGNYNQFVVGHNGSFGTYNLSNGTMNIPNNEFHVGRQGGTGVFNQTGGVVNNSNAGAQGSLHIGYGGNSKGTYNMSGGTLNFRQFSIGNNNATDQGWFNHSGGRVTNNGVGNSWISIGSSNAGSGTWTATGGSLDTTSGIELGYRTGTSGIVTVAGTADYSIGGTLSMSGANPGLSTLSRFNLEGGTFRADTITVANTATEFNWGSGVLGLRTTSGTAGSADLSLGTNYSPFVAHGRQLTFQQGGYTGTGANETIATGSGINASGLHAAGGNSVLNLGGLYLSAGVRYNKAVFNDGMSLDASAAGDTLLMDTALANDTVYLLRPFGFFTEDYGSLPLIQFSGGGSMTGTFDTFIGLMDDGKGFGMSTFAVTTATANTLAVNTWYLEQTASGVTFHYKVAGAVPEPGTFSLSLLGVWIARSLRRRAASAATPLEAPGAGVKLVRVRLRRDAQAVRTGEY